MSTSLSICITHPSLRLPVYTIVCVGAFVCFRQSERQSERQRERESKGDTGYDTHIFAIYTHAHPARVPSARIKRRNTIRAKRPTQDTYCTSKETCYMSNARPKRPIICQMHVKRDLLSVKTDLAREPSARIQPASLRWWRGVR